MTVSIAVHRLSGAIQEKRLINHTFSEAQDLAWVKSKQKTAVMVIARDGEREQWFTKGKRSDAFQPGLIADDREKEEQDDSDAA